jgi:lipoate-protein ligase B
VSGWAVHLPGLCPYEAVFRLQEALVRARMDRTIPDVVLFLEHRKVVTLGNRGRRDHLLLSEDALKQKGIDLIHSSRGGDVTYHGPGQVVMYPIIQLGDCEADSHGYLCNLEEIALRTASDFGIPAFRRPGMTGGWCDQGKFSAIGIRLRRWVTFHGMSLNVDLDLEDFQVITPCGLSGEAVTSFRHVLGDDVPGIVDVRQSMFQHFQEICSRELQWFDSRETWPDRLRELIEVESL